LAKIRFNVFKLNGNFFHGNAEIITSITSENNFDLVYSFGVIHHTTNPRAVIEEAYKLLKAGGELRIMLYNKNSWKSFMIECGMDQPEAQSGCPVALAYDESDIHELIGDLFDIDSITNEHIFPYVIENYRKNEYTLEPWFREMPEKMFKHLEKKLGWHTLIKATKKLA
jgi:SAM-dependent methyltransferase